VKPGLPAPDPAATCLITGASSGIGEAIARELAARGYGLTLVARRAERLHALSAELSARHSIRVEAMPADLTDASSRSALPEKLAQAGLRVDVLVNNAGIGSYGHFAELDSARELEQVRVICEAPVALCATFIPAMVARSAGAVIIISSTTGFQPTARYATYAAAKAFSLSFGQSLRAELRTRGVAVTTVCPGPVETPFFTSNHVEPVRLPKPMWTTAERVARDALRGVARNRRVVIPGLPMRALMLVSRASPASLQLSVMDLLLREKATIRQ
jgi:uncharacterized protein